MSDAENAERWRRQQDRRVEKQAQQVVADWMERQNKLKPGGGELNDGLAELVEGLDKLAQKAGGDYTTATGIPSHSDTAVIQADHGPGYDPTLALIAVFSIVQKLNDLLGNTDKVFAATGEKTVEEIGANIAGAWDQFKEDVVAIVEDVEQQIMELVSPEKTQDQAPIEQHPARDGAAEERPVNGDAPAGRSDTANQPDTGLRMQDKVQPDAADPEMTALKAKQAKEIANDAAQIAEQRRRFADSPDNLKEVNKAAVLAERLTATKHATELQKFVEQRQLQHQQQQIQQQPISNPSDPGRNR
jgi:X-X-X-Leu-X-X-Gly heptad repeat protein